MSLTRWRMVCVVVGLAVTCWPALAQQFTPHAGYVYPAGGRQGTTFEVIVGGQFLDGVSTAVVSGPGVQAAVAEHIKLMTQAQFNRLRDQLNELLERRNAALKRNRKGDAETQAGQKAVWTEEDEKQVAEIRKKLATFIRRPANPSIAEQVRVLITIAPDAPPGQRELRLGTPNGLTNPLAFCVGQLPEFSLPPSKVLADMGPNQAPRARYAQFGPPDDRPTGPVKITLPAVINGQILPAGVDRYKFQATKGQRLVVSVAARSLIPYISDAVPGWFQATAALYDPKGKEVRYVDDYRFHPDPVLYYEVPEDGEYTLEIKDAIYRGREDFVYRITIGELPFITSIFPLGGKAGTQAQIELRGWNLPVSRLSQSTKDKAPGVYPISVRKGDMVSNRLPFAVDTLPESFEKESNNTIKSAQKVKLPLIINGRIDRPGDVDVYRFEGKAGEEIVAEIMARRLESPLDSILRLTDGNGRQIAINDDFEDKGMGLLTHQADSRIMVKLPANGSYYLHVADTQHKGGPEYAYRLRIGAPEPGFDLRVVPSSVSARGGTTVPITVYALRKDGFTGEIALRLKDAPRGFALSGAWVPSGQDKVRLTLTVPATRFDIPVKLHLEGRAMVRGKEMVRLAVPSEDMMQAFAYRHLVPANEWMVRVTPPRRFEPTWKVALDKPLRLSPGGAAPVKVLAPTRAFGGEVRLTLSEPPEGITIQEVTTSRDGVAIVLRADAGKVKPGLRGNLIVDAYREASSGGGSKKTAASRRLLIGTLPAIPFEVVSP